MRQFVILRHETPAGSQQPSHFDVMLEKGDALCTWSISEPLVPGAVLRAQRKPDHRLVYLTYEGEVSRGRGMVRRVAHGRYMTLHQTESYWAVLLDSPQVRGTLICQQSGPDLGDWQLQLVGSTGGAE